MNNEEVEFFDNTKILENAIKRSTRNFSIAANLFLICLIYAGYEGLTRYGWIGLLVAILLGLQAILLNMDIRTYTIQKQINSGIAKFRLEKII